jgi:hypothetical protein
MELPVTVFILDAILSFDISYQAEPALYNLRIFAEGSLIVIFLIKLDFKLGTTPDKVCSPLLAN